MKFEDWFYEIEVFSIRAERFYDDLSDYTTPRKTAEQALEGNRKIVEWLKAAYEVGREHERLNKE